MAFGPEYASTMQQGAIYGGDMKVADAGAEQSALSAMASTLERANMLAHRVSQLADRLVGPQPTPVQGGMNSSSPSAVFPALRAAAYETGAYVTDALNALDRIERALP